MTAAAYGPSNRRFIEGRGGGIRFAETAPGRRARRGGHRASACAGPTPSSSAARPPRSGPSHTRRRSSTSGACDRALVLAVEIFEECADSTPAHGRRTADPLVEAAACLWLEPRAAARSHLRARGCTRAAARRDAAAAAAGGAGETFSAARPLAALDRSGVRPRAGHRPGPLERRTARWRQGSDPARARILDRRSQAS